MNEEKVCLRSFEINDESLKIQKMKYNIISNFKNEYSKNLLMLFAFDNQI